MVAGIAFTSGLGGARYGPLFLSVIVGFAALDYNTIEPDTVVLGVWMLPEVRRRAQDAGFELTPSTPKAVTERMRSDAAQIAPLVGDGRLVLI